MILTVTMNPSVDIGYRLETFLLDDVNRVTDVSKTAGGKGLNVARVIHDLGLEVGATGIIGGTLGNFITEKLAEQHLREYFFKINKESRNCIAILHEGKQTEILEKGPHISEEETAAFLEYFQQLIETENISVLTISGSLPKGMTADVYKRLISLANQKDIPVVLDTSGSVLIEVLEVSSLKIAAIKPNQDELSAIENKELSTNPSEWQEILETPRYDQIDWVIISLGAAGAFAKHKHDFYQVAIPSIEVVNPVGSGDATVAGIAVALNQALGPEDLLRTAMTTGMLNTMEMTTGTVKKDLFHEYFNQVTIKKL